MKILVVRSRPPPQNNHQGETVAASGNSCMLGNNWWWEVHSRDKGQKVSERWCPEDSGHFGPVVLNSLCYFVETLVSTWWFHFLFKPVSVLCDFRIRNVWQSQFLTGSSSHCVERSSCDFVMILNTRVLKLEFDQYSQFSSTTLCRKQSYTTSLFRTNIFVALPVAYLFQNKNTPVSSVSVVNTPALTGLIGRIWKCRCWYPGD